MLFDITSKEVSIDGIYIPTILIVMLISIMMTSGTVLILNKLKWYRYIVCPPLVELSIAIVYVIIIGFFIIPI
ncbi:DUF1656 domain-containing protein [Photobacterium sp. S4TG1]|uniref:DUF1656 domain-containing protein n=1 Tax=Photobacterium sp. S4TG1 TaxID=3114587 RepID=UPI003FA72694